MNPSKQEKSHVYSLYQITENMDLVMKISEVPSRNDNPRTPIKMISVRVA